MNSIRTMLTIGALLDLEIHSMDVVTAYLNGKLEKGTNIYMEPPVGFRQPGDNRVCLLKKGLYGLKQAGRTWYYCLLEHLLSIGFTPLKSDSCLYIRRQGDLVTIISVSTDDLIIMASNLEMMAQFKLEMTQRFKMVDQGELKHILGMEICRNREAKTIMLNQSIYIKNMLTRYDMLNCATATTPMACDALSELVFSNCPSSASERKEMENIPYRQAIGSLTYLATCTRPDIAAAVGILSKFVTNPGPVHWSGVKRIFRYLQGTRDFGLKLGGDPSLPLIVTGYCDSDWAGDHDDRKSRAGYIFMLNDSLLTFRSFKPGSVSNSSTEAELKSSHGATCEAVWIRRLVKELGHPQRGPTVIYEDNKGCIEISKNDVHSSRMKHVDIKYFFIREKVASKEVKLESIPGTDNPSDIMTKPLPQASFEKYRTRMGIMDKSHINDPGTGV
jgi:hypothetical protein